MARDSDVLGLGSHIGFWGLGFRVLGFRVLGFRVQGCWGISFVIGCGFRNAGIPKVFSLGRW